MRALLESEPGRSATFPAAQLGSASGRTGGQPDSESSQWFVAAVRTIIGKDAGLHLHHITGYPERSCYRYASGERHPPSDFLRILFRSDHGLPFFLAFMHGSEARWWKDHQRALKLADAAERFAREVEDRL